MRSTARVRGFTLTELILVLGVLGVLVGLAVPSMATFIQRKRVDASAQELATTLRFARSLPLQTGHEIVVRFSSTDAFTCYSVHSSPGFATCNCARYPEPTCTTSELNDTQPTEYKTVILQRNTGLEVSAAPTTAQYFRGTGLPSVASLEATLSSTRGGSLRVYTNSAGLPKICSVADHPVYPSCS